MKRHFALAVFFLLVSIPFLGGIFGMKFPAIGLELEIVPNIIMLVITLGLGLFFYNLKKIKIMC